MSYSGGGIYWTSLPSTFDASGVSNSNNAAQHGTNIASKASKIVWTVVSGMKGNVRMKREREGGERGRCGAISEGSHCMVFCVWCAQGSATAIASNEFLPFAVQVALQDVYNHVVAVDNSTVITLAVTSTTIGVTPAITGTVRACRCWVCNACGWPSCSRRGHSDGGVYENLVMLWPHHCAGQTRVTLNRGQHTWQPVG